MLTLGYSFIVVLRHSFILLSVEYFTFRENASSFIYTLTLPKVCDLDRNGIFKSFVRTTPHSPPSRLQVGFLLEWSL